MTKRENMSSRIIIQIYQSLRQLPLLSVGFTKLSPLLVWHMKQSSQLTSTDCNLAGEIISNSLDSIMIILYCILLSNYFLKDTE